MIDEQEFLNDFHAMDDTRQQQMALVIKALGIEYPRKAQPKLSLVRPIRSPDSLGEGLQNYN